MAHDVALTYIILFGVPIYQHFTHLYVKVLIQYFQMYAYIESPNTFFHLEQLSFVVFSCSRIRSHIQLHYFMLKALK